jgi:hypothetical protein
MEQRTVQRTDPRLKAVNHLVALLAEALEVIQLIRNAPESPMTSYLPAKLRRVFRRNARRLRRGTLQPLYLNLRTGPDLADLCDRTAARDETIDVGLEKLTRIGAEVRRVLEYNEAEVEEGTRIVYELARERAEEDGPDSEAAVFLHLFQEMIVKGGELRARKRRGRDSVPIEPFVPPGADPELEERERLSAAEVLMEPPPAGEPVFCFPSDTIAPNEKPPVLLRIGIADASWVGSFRRGETDYSTVQMMPDGAHLLVVTCGAAYVVHAATRSLVSEEGMDIMEVVRDEDGDLLLVDQRDSLSEAAAAPSTIARV